MATWFRGDCLHVLQALPAKTVKLILWDPPFGTTKHSWDEKLPWSKIFHECFRILTDDGTLVIHASVPFNYLLIREAPRPPNYSWYWKKNFATNPFLANHQPLRIVEEILVWRMKKNTYYRQNIGDSVTEYVYPKDNAKGYYDGSPGGAAKVVGRTRTHLLEMARKVDGFSTRPDEMIELMIKTYSKEGEVVLDPTCYKGISGVIAKRLGRKWIGIDKHFFPQLLLDGNSRRSRN